MGKSSPENESAPDEAQESREPSAAPHNGEGKNN